jgi:hypothetical protein
LVVVTAIGLAALRANSPLWAGVVLLLTCGVLALAAIATITQRGSERAWWLGVATFGWGYLALVYATTDYDGIRPQLPTSLLLIKLESKPNVPKVEADRGFGLDGRDRFESHELRYHGGHAAFALLAGLTGGIMSRLVLGGALSRSNGGTVGQKIATEVVTNTSGRTPKQSPRLRFRTVCAVGAVIAAVGLIALFSGSLAAGSLTFLLTCAWLALVAVGTVLGQGVRRARWAGAALFGWGYFFLALNSRAIVSMWPFEGKAEPPYMLNAGDSRYVYYRSPTFARWLTRFARSSDRATMSVLKALDEPIPMSFPSDTAFEDVLRYITSATRSRDLPDGLKFYVDPSALPEGGPEANASPVTIDLQNVPLRVSLRLLVTQLNLSYAIENGFIHIMNSSDIERIPVVYDPVGRLMHCAIAVLAACMGGALAPLVYDARSESKTSS